MHVDRHGQHVIVVRQDHRGRRPRPDPWHRGLWQHPSVRGTGGILECLEVAGVVGVADGVTQVLAAKRGHCGYRMALWGQIRHQSGEKRVTAKCETKPSLDRKEKKDNCAL